MLWHHKQNEGVASNLFGDSINGEMDLGYRPWINKANSLKPFQQYRGPTIQRSNNTGPCDWQPPVVVTLNHTYQTSQTVPPSLPGYSCRQDSSQTAAPSVEFNNQSINQEILIGFKRFTFHIRYLLNMFNTLKLG